MIKLAIVGCGRHAIQKFLNIDRYIPQLRLTAVCERNPAVAAAIKELRKNISVFQEFDDLMSRCDVDIVIIASDPASHYALAKKCIESGKNVLIEKPMTATLDEAERLQAIHNLNPVKAMVGFHRRFGVPENRLRTMVSEGMLGDVRAIQVTHNFNDASRSPVSGYLFSNDNDLGGVIYEYMSHEIDFLRFLFPECALDAFQVNTGAHLHKGDVSTIQLRVNASIHASFLLCSLTTDYEEYRIFGSEGQAIFNRYRHTAPIFRSVKSLRNRPLRVLKEWWEGVNSVRVIKYGIRKFLLQPYINELDYFMKCILADRVPVPSISEGLFVMRILGRLYEAPGR